jgi:hypothetical protein
MTIASAILLLCVIDTTLIALTTDLAAALGWVRRRWL